MLRLLHISDLHFGPPYRHQVGEAVLELAPTLNADAVVISGDLTQRAKPQQFLAAKKFLAQLPDVPQLVIPGNHDVPLYRVLERLLNPHGLYREIISNELNPVLKLDQAVLVGLDSTSPRRTIVSGKIDSDQLRICRQAFADVSPDALRIIVAHHHFAPAHDNKKDRKILGRRAIDCFVDLGVDMILGGHLHRAYIGNSLDFYRGNHRDQGIIIVQCGTTTSSRGVRRETGKNTLNLIDVCRDMITVTHYLYFDADNAFAPLSRHTFPRAGRRIRVPEPEERMREEATCVTV